MPGLTLKQEAFINAYLGEAAGNGTLAARLAGYSGSDNTLAVTASRLLTHPNIVTRVRDAREEIGITRRMLIENLWDVATDRTPNNGIARVQASKLIGSDLHGMFQPVAEQRDNEVRIIVVRESLPPADRIQIASNVATPRASASTEPDQEEHQHQQ